MILPNSDPTRPFRDEGVILAAVLGIAVLDMPYGYYQFVRFLVCLAGIAIAVSGRSRMLTLFGVVAAILFNPLWPIHFTKDIWRWLDGLFAIAFLAIGFAVRSPRPIKDEEELTEGSLHGSAK
jgi:hypothetical protein